MYGGFVESQSCARVSVETGFGLGEELAGGGKELAILRGTLLVEREGGQADSEDEKCRRDGDGSAAAASVAADAGPQKVPGAGAELDATRDPRPGCGAGVATGSLILAPK